MVDLSGIAPVMCYSPLCTSHMTNHPLSQHIQQQRFVSFSCFGSSRVDSDSRLPNWHPAPATADRTLSSPNAWTQAVQKRLITSSVGNPWNYSDKEGKPSLEFPIYSGFPLCSLKAASNVSIISSMGLDRPNLFQHILSFFFFLAAY